MQRIHQDLLLVPARSQPESF